VSYFDIVIRRLTQGKIHIGIVDSTGSMIIGKKQERYQRAQDTSGSQCMWATKSMTSRNMGQGVKNEKEMI
jgi:hypothetical protein